MEAAQSYLPARTPSNLDVLCNAAGTLLGALAGQRASPWEQPLRQWRARALQPGAQATSASRCSACGCSRSSTRRRCCLAAGDLRDLLAGPAGPARAPELFVAIEAVTAAANLAAVGLLVSCNRRARARRCA